MNIPDNEQYCTKKRSLTLMASLSVHIPSHYIFVTYDPKIIAWALWLLLLLAGDVEQNPGPGRSRGEYSNSVIP